MPLRTTHITPTYNTATNACGRLLRVDDGNLAQHTVYSVNVIVHNVIVETHSFPATTITISPFTPVSAND
ncbi:MAG: hypothetical protein IJT51_01905 [Bacteroidales bacterium]|nr:hypothetical protein [Bacteroidales bacterium]